MPSSLNTRGPLARRDPSQLPRDHVLPAIYRLRVDQSAPVTARGELARDAALASLEAVLFAADEPLPARRLAKLIGLADTAEARRLVRKLQGLYDRDGTAFQMEELAGGFQLLTRPMYHPWLLRLRRTGNELKLSPAARETLAIIAYRQPIMRADIESIRGVQCGDILRVLMEKGLVRIAGRHDSLGRPVLYGTTRKFLQAFGLKNLHDLPLVEQLRQPDSKG
ncbi:MAG TPA: SMC-Scp complex subunit ScpB [Gemmataceae bacterium]|nr:SMC-Scp complex subunit ScpB [Gemmataceae bacterium]